MQHIEYKKDRMVYANITDYFDYIERCMFESFSNNTKLIVMFSGIFATIYSMIDNLAASLAVHAFFLVAYFILALGDTVTGIAASMYVEKQKFSSAKFIKKVFLIGFCLLIVFITELLVIVFSNYSHNENIILEGFLEVLVFAFHVIKIALLLAFIIYELTSLRENFIRLKLDEFVHFVDIFIYPLKKLNSFLDAKYDAVLKNTGGTDTPKPKEDETTA